jgi:hypothetical protein
MMLVEWGKWCRMGGPQPKGAKSWLGVLQDRLVQQNRGPGLMFSDDFCDGFDRSVMRVVKEQWPDAFSVLRAYYADGLNSRDMAKRLGKSKTAGLDLLRVAIGRVDTLVKAGVAA